MRIGGVLQAWKRPEIFSSLSVFVFFCVRGDVYVEERRIYDCVAWISLSDRDLTQFSRSKNCRSNLNKTPPADPSTISPNFINSVEKSRSHEVSESLVPTVDTRFSVTSAANM